MKVKIKLPRSRPEITEELHSVELEIIHLRERLATEGPEQLGRVAERLRRAGEKVVRLADELDRVVPPTEPAA